MKMSFSLMVASAEPPRTVKSSPVTATCRPSILARPITALAGIRCDEILVLVVLGLAGHAADLAERARIDQAIDALAHRETAAVMLALHLVRAAHLPRHRLAPVQLVDLRLPRHVVVRLSCFASRCLVATADPDGHIEKTMRLVACDNA